MGKELTSLSTKRLLYCADAICEKIDLHTEAFVKRIEALRRGDIEQAEFIEKMMLEPLDKQIRYLAEKASNLGKEKQQNGQ